MQQAQLVHEGRATGALKFDIEKAKRVAQAMIADGDRVTDRNRLLGHIREFGLARNPWLGLSHYQDWNNASVLGLQQIPTEFADFLLYCVRYRPASMAEIGVFTGGSCLIAASFFKALNADFRYVGIDLEAGVLLPDDVLELLGVELRIPATSEDLIGETFDIVFIDGDHSYHWAKNDFIGLGSHARFVCGFHDINSREYRQAGGGVFKYWRQLRQSLSRDVPMYEISHAPLNCGVEQDGDWMGIGVVDFGMVRQTPPRVA
ncbi:hypothetical protein CFI11_04115 [Thalassococcus sp. S3]|nr:hypothetical protein CFI11_04115 [Thalassococcus sp. S3]